MIIRFVFPYCCLSKFASPNPYRKDNPFFSQKIRTIKTKDRTLSTFSFCSGNLTLCPDRRARSPPFSLWIKVVPYAPFSRNGQKSACRSNDIPPDSLTFRQRLQAHRPAIRVSRPVEFQAKRQTLRQLSAHSTGVGKATFLMIFRTIRHTCNEPCASSDPVMRKKRQSVCGKKLQLTTWNLK